MNRLYKVYRFMTQGIILENEKVKIKTSSVFNYNKLKKSSFLKWILKLNKYLFVILYYYLFLTLFIILISV